MHRTPVKCPNQKISTVFYIQDGELYVHTQPRGVRCDLHVHSFFSGYDPTRGVEGKNRWVETNPPRKLAVRESYTTPKKVYIKAKQRGMDLVTISDHDSVDGAIGLVELSPENTFVSCEYTVDGSEGFFVHVQTPGLDYPKGSDSRLDSSQVRKLHEELKKVRNAGYKEFRKACDSLGVRCGLNHPASVFNGPVPSAKLLKDWAAAFDYLEINSDGTLENIINEALAKDLGKTIYSGTDSHNSRRIGMSYTETTVPAGTPLEFLRAFDEGNIAIGSRSTADSFLERFATPIPLFVDDVYGGIRDYFVSKEGLKDYFREGGWRKWALTAGLVGLPVALSAIAGPAIGILPFALVEGGFFTVIPYKTAIDQRRKEARNAYRLWDSYVSMKFQAEMEPYKDILEEIEEKKKAHESDRARIRQESMVDVTGFAWLVNKIFGRFNWFSSKYRDGIK